MASETEARRFSLWMPSDWARSISSALLRPGAWARSPDDGAAHVALRHAEIYDVAPLLPLREPARGPDDARVPIVAFAKDWHEDPTSNHHVLRELARTRRVLWLSSIGTRTPELRSSRDLAKLRRKLAELAAGPVNVEHDLWVATPPVLPFPHSRAARIANHRLLAATLRRWRRRLGIERFQLWTFLPNTGAYIGRLGEELSVYYCVDEWSLFSYLDREATLAAEREQLARVDAVFTINHALGDKKREHNPQTYVSPHGVDHALFARALDDATTIPEDLAALPGPRIGFYGTLRDWVDYDLIEYVARARPRWSIVLIGQQLADLSSLRRLRNVHLLGQRPHAELPAYCKGFDVGIIPYRLEPRMRFVNPLKMREYLSAGLPVVSTPVPEVTRYANLCRVAATRGEFLAALDGELERAREGGTMPRAARSAAMKGESWAARVADVMRTVDNVSKRNHK